MTQDEAFLRAILEEPDDDTHRLVYADWLEEHGKADRAEFIRVQCELARLPRGDPRKAGLEAREQALFGAHEEEWTEMLPRAVIGHVFERGFLSWVEMPASGFSHLRSVFDWFPTVRHLHLLGPFRDRKPRIQAVAASPLLASLDSLEISKGYYHVGPEAVITLLGSPHLGRLTGLSLHECAIGSHGVAAIAGSALLGRLHVLSLSLYGFRPTEFLGPEAARALASSPHIGGLKVLALASCGLGDEGCAPLLEAPALAGIGRLDLRENIISEGMKGRLRERFGERVLF